MDCQGEAEHQRVKKHYKRASKSAFTRGIAKINRRERILRAIHQRKKVRDAMDAEEQQETHLGSTAAAPTPTPRLDFTDQEALPYTAPEMRYHISSQTKHPIQLASWLREHRDDASFKVS